jgi:lipid-A-disaccharide synthase
MTRPIYDKWDEITMLAGLEQNRPLLVMAGEPSGDRIASRVIEAVQRQHPCDVFGVGGDNMARAGAELVDHIDHLTALGIGDVARRFVRWSRVWANVRQAVAERKPKVALLVDSPEVNLPLARVLRQEGVQVVYYVGPQVWAWRRGRIGLLRERCDVTALILPFEKTIYDANRVHAVFVGHPLLDEPLPEPRERVRKGLGVGEQQKLVAFLPGSRPGEVTRHSAPMRSAAKRLGERGVHTVFAPGVSSPDASQQWHTRDLLGAADGAVVASGTATLEAAVLGTPLAVVYRMGKLSWFTAKRLVKVPWVGLPNLVAGKQIVPELLQGHATGEAIFRQACTLLEPEEQRRQRRELGKVRERLGTPGAATRVAALVLERLK